MLFLARPIVEDTPLPWQRRQTRLTPQRVRQSLKPIFAPIGSPARAPKTVQKTAWPAQRKAANAQTALQSGQEGRRGGAARLQW